MRYLILAFLAFGFRAEASLRLYCWSSVWNMDSETELAKLEAAESYLEFAPVNSMEYRANIDFGFLQIPNARFNLTVTETLKGNRLTWSSKIVQLNEKTKKIVRRGRNFLEWEAGSYQMRVECDAYDKTLSLKAEPEPKTAREKLRRLFINGGGPAKEYVRGDSERAKRLRHNEDEDGADVWWAMDRLEPYDLIKQLLHSNVPLSGSLRKVFSLLYPDEDNWFDPSNQIPVFAEVRFKQRDLACGCDHEEFLLRFKVDSVSMALMDGESAFGFGGFEVLGTIVRGTKDRLIREYRIHEVRVDHPVEIDGGGGQSSSGGRINGR